MALALLGAASALGAMPASAQIVQARAPASVQAALESAGYKPELKKDNTGDPLIMIDAQGYKMMVMFFGCKANAECTSVAFYAASRAAKKIDPQAVNNWNYNHRFGRGYLDKEGDPSLQFDVDLDDGGMSRELFIDNLEWFTVAFDNFKTEMAK